MSEKRYTVGLQSKTIFDMKTELYLFDNKIICEVLNAQNSLICEQQATINKLQDKLFAMQHTIDNQENAIFHLKDTDDNLRKKNIRIEELSKVVHNLKMVLSSDDEQVAKIVGEQQATINELKAKLKEKEEDERLYANEILELREANKEFIQFKELGGDY